MNWQTNLALPSGLLLRPKVVHPHSRRVPGIGVVRHVARLDATEEWCVDRRARDDNLPFGRGRQFLQQIPIAD